MPRYLNTARLIILSLFAGLCVGFAPMRWLPAFSSTTRTEEKLPLWNTKQPWQDNRPEPKSARERVAFKNKVPFSEEMYGTIKSAIELLSKRSRSDPAPQVLSVEEATWLRGAVDRIIDDAKMYGPPARPERKTEGGKASVLCEGGGCQYSMTWPAIL